MGGEDVNCGAHTAPNCQSCPQGNGRNWCNGECQWTNNQCQASQDYGRNEYDCPHCGDYDTECWERCLGK